MTARASEQAGLAGHTANSAEDPGTPHIDIQELTPGILLARIVCDPLGQFGPDLAAELEALVSRAEREDAVRAVILTGTHPGRFISHASIDWLHSGGQQIPPISARTASKILRLTAGLRRVRAPYPLLFRSPLAGAAQLDRLHHTLIRMNSCGTIFIAVLNGSALGLGAEIAWACDLRLMAEGDYVIGQPEILLGINPGGGGTQRLTRLVGTHRSLLAILEGKPLPTAEALDHGAIDELVVSSELIDRAVGIAARLGTRPKHTIAAVKRCVYLGGSKTLAEGLHTERAEFISNLSNADAQERLQHYLALTAREGELPFYKPEAYRAALDTGDFENLP